MNNRPNILLIMNDDMGYSDIGCYGGEIDTPNLDQLASKGIRFTHFYNTARCCPTRASLLTGLHPHQTGIGVLVNDDGPEGYPGNLNDRCVTIAEVLKTVGYGTYMSGKWHVAHDIFNVNETWPCQRGFDHFYGIINGAANYFHPGTLTRDNTNVEHEAENNEDFYLTDAITEEAIKFIKVHRREHPNKPFFQYVAYTAPHWPLHAPAQTIEKYRGKYDEGWDILRKKRMERMVELGIVDPKYELTHRDVDVPPWEEADNQAWRTRCMEVYAAQIDRMDAGIGNIIDALDDIGELDNTLIFFLSDNGGSAEELKPGLGKGFLQKTSGRAQTKRGEAVLFGNRPELVPGDERTYQSYGRGWANLSNTPFRLYKHWIHEGGIATPFIVHWPDGPLQPGTLCEAPGQLTDIMATILDVTGIDYPEEYHGRPILPAEGSSLLDALKGKPLPEKSLFWEHEGNAAMRRGRWKLVRNYPGDWELYDLEQDRTETKDLAAVFPERVLEMSVAYDEWAKRCGVIPREDILKIMDCR